MAATSEYQNALQLQMKHNKISKTTTKKKKNEKIYKNTDNELIAIQFFFFLAENGPIIQVLAYVQVFPFHEHN